MAYTNDGIEAAQTVAIRGETADTPTDLSFSGSDNTFTGTESSMVNEYIRKTVTWSKTGIQSLYRVELTSTEAIGSTIEALGLVSSPTIGLGTLHTIDESFIGLKNDEFSVQIEGEVIMRRPL